MTATRHGTRHGVAPVQRRRQPIVRAPPCAATGGVCTPVLVALLLYSLLGQRACDAAVHCVRVCSCGRAVWRCREGGAGRAGTRARAARHRPRRPPQSHAGGDGSLLLEQCWEGCVSCRWGALPRLEGATAATAALPVRSSPRCCHGRAKRCNSCAPGAVTRARACPGRKEGRKALALLGQVGAPHRTPNRARMSERPGSARGGARAVETRRAPRPTSWQHCTACIRHACCCRLPLPVMQTPSLRRTPSPLPPAAAPRAHTEAERADALTARRGGSNAPARCCCVGTTVTVAGRRGSGRARRALPTAGGDPSVGRARRWVV